MKRAKNRYLTTKKEKPDRNKSTNKYTFKTPRSGIKIINKRSERLYLSKNIQTYTVIAPPSRPVMRSLPVGRSWLGVGVFVFAFGTGSGVVCKASAFALSRRDLTSKKA